MVTMYSQYVYHMYEAADNTRFCFVFTRKNENQSIIVSGESGAGKVQNFADVRGSTQETAIDPIKEVITFVVFFLNSFCGLEAYIHYMITICSPHAHYIFTLCSPQEQPAEIKRERK